MRGIDHLGAVLSALSCGKTRKNPAGQCVAMDDVKVFTRKEPLQGKVRAEITGRKGIAAKRKGMKNVAKRKRTACLVVRRRHVRFKALFLKPFQIRQMERRDMSCRAGRDE